MPKSLYVLPYKAGSKSAKSLADSLGVTVLRKGNESKFVPNNSKLIINWGATSGIKDSILGSQMLNRPNRVASASNKKTFFTSLTNAAFEYVPKVFFSKNDALTYWAADPTRRVIFARTVLNGHSGEGIHILRTVNDWDTCPPCNLFVEYVKKQDEYRVHFTDFRNWLPDSGPEVIFIQRKGFKVSNGQTLTAEAAMIRNVSNGYAYVTEGGNISTETVPTAVKITILSFLNGYQHQLFGLDFGAIDIIYNKHYNIAYILEVNTAPGLAGTTIQKYTEAFKSLANQL